MWIQGRNDQKYLERLRRPTNLQLIPATLEAYENRLTQGNIDYVGTRLHAGIFALNHQVRSIIISVDNRAAEIANDTNLPVLQRNQIEEELEKWIIGTWKTNIYLKQDNIERFKAQLRRT